MGNELPDDVRKLIVGVFKSHGFNAMAFHLPLPKGYSGLQMGTLGAFNTESLVFLHSNGWNIAKHVAIKVRLHLFVKFLWQANALEMPAVDSEWYKAVLLWNSWGDCILRGRYTDDVLWTSTPPLEALLLP